MADRRDRNLVPVPPLVLPHTPDDATRDAIRSWVSAVAEEVFEYRDELATRATKLEAARVLARRLRDHDTSLTWDLEECDLLIQLCETLGVDDEPGKPPAGQEH